MLNEKLNIDKLHNIYAANKKITICNALKNEVAEKLLLSLQNDIPWQLAYMEKGVSSLFSAEQLSTMPAEQLEAVYEKIVKSGGDNFQFCYYHYSILGGNISQCADNAYVNTFKEFLQSDVFFDFAKAVTGISEVKNIEIQAARYTANNFLMMHNDSANPNRRFAYVLNLSKNWHVDFGGVLHFIDQSGKITESIIPTFNSLVFFTVPALHKVSYVMPFVKQSRYTVTGWLDV